MLPSVREIELALGERTDYTLNKQQLLNKF